MHGGTNFCRKSKSPMPLAVASAAPSSTTVLVFFDQIPSDFGREAVSFQPTEQTQMKGDSRSRSRPSPAATFGLLDPTLYPYLNHAQPKTRLRAIGVAAYVFEGRGPKVLDSLDYFTRNPDPFLRDRAVQVIPNTGERADGGEA